MGLGDEGCCIGMKVLLQRGTVVRRGVIMLEPAVVQVLGGKVEAWDRAWREGRKERLKRELEVESQRGRAGVRVDEVGGAASMRW